jgi:hypothetical protein
VGVREPGQTENRVKVSLTESQASHLLCIGGQCNLETLTARIAQALLAVTVASVLVVQFAMTG